MQCEKAKKFTSNRIAFFFLKNGKIHQSIALLHLHRITSPD
jgi:hypothetical protein